MTRIHRRTVQKDLHGLDNHDGVITHMEPDILECEVKWALESITTNKTSGGDGIPIELFQILEDDAVKVRSEERIRDRNGMDLTGAEDIKKRWQEYTEELYKKIFTTKIIMMM